MKMDAGRWARALMAAFCASALLGGCTNSPQPDGAESTNTLFSAFAERSPRYLDPTASYSNNETPITFQVYEPLYGYHYLKRPYELVPKLAEALVEPKYLDKSGRSLPDDADAALIAESVYDIPIKKGVMYAPHPAFAKDAQGRFLYHDMKVGEVGDRRSPWQFAQRGTRELVAEDFVYAMKRQATTRLPAPIYGIFSEYVVGLKDYGKLIREQDKALRAGKDPAALDKPFLDFRKYPLDGVVALDSHTVRIRIIGKYPQWKYWLAMTFTAPVPWEADEFYAQPGMAKNGLSLNVWPAGTGPYMLTDYVQDRRHVLKRNPNFRGEPYPCEGMPKDREQGLLADCGKTMPFIDTLIFNAEKEAVPLKAKFVQGYLDVPEIERPEFGIEYALDMADSDRVNKEYTAKGFKLPRTVDISNWYVGFNWLDPVVGKGTTPDQQVRNRKLRQALSIAIDWDEYSRIFPKKGGETAMGPLPGGLFGSRHGTPEGLNPVTHRLVDGRPVRRSLDEAKALLAEAGYVNGRDDKNGRPLVLNYDYQRVPTPEIKSELDWMVKQFAKLGVQLEIRATDYNQFQDKMRKGAQQIFFWGWLADYPDAENYLFLLYGPNSKAKADGENTANYENPEYDRRYNQLRLMDDGPAKQKVIDEMVSIVQQDAIWSFGWFPFSSGAYQPWVFNGKPGIMIRDMAKYYRLDPAMRAQKQAEWNRPDWWPMVLIAMALLAVAWGARRTFRRRERLNARGEVLA
ncbi:MAG: ABC transporter substrate-binding protein [Caldimonas sp.]